MDKDTDNNISDSEVTELLTGYFKSCGHAPEMQPCPSEEVLADYLGNRLAEASRQVLERHLRHCDTCIEAVIAAAALPEQEGQESITAIPLSAIQKVLSRIGANDAQPLQELWKRLKAACSGFVNSLMEIIFFKETEVVYVRGNRHIISKNLVVIEKVFKEIKLEIEVEKIGEKAANIKVRVSAPDSGARVDGVRVNILSNSREIASFITAGGEALFENIAFGEYSISVHQNGKKLGHLLLDVKES